MYTTYQIECINGRTYYGSTGMEIAERWGTHRAYLRLNRHYNRELQADWNKLGPEAFTFGVLQTQHTKKGAKAHEHSLMTEDDATYNVRGVTPEKYRRGPRLPKGTGYSGHAALLTRSDIAVMQKLKSRMHGYEIAEVFNVSPSLVSIALRGKYQPTRMTVL